MKNLSTSLKIILSVLFIGLGSLLFSREFNLFFLRGEVEWVLLTVLIFVIFYFILIRNKIFVANNRKHIILISSIIVYGTTYFRSSRDYMYVFTSSQFYENYRLPKNGDFIYSIAISILLGLILSIALKKAVPLVSENVGFSPLTKNYKVSSTMIYFIFFISITLLIGGFSKKKNSMTSDCKGAGNESCIEKVRQNFSNTGKTILGEQYLGDGRFGISFMDSQHPGAYNTTISTDCKCNITSSNVSTIR